MYLRYKSVWWVVFGVVLHCCGVLVGGQCWVDPSIEGEDAAHAEDIIGKLEPLYGARVTTTDAADGTSYTVAICSDAGKQFPNSSIILNKGTDTELMWLRNRTTAAKGENWLEVGFLSDTNYTDGPCLGQPRTAKVLLTCQPDKFGLAAFQLVEDYLTGPNCYIQLSGSHSVACDHIPHTGLGGFAIFLIILLVCLAAYFLFGFAYLRFMKGAKGPDQIPHRFFWFGVGNSIANCAGAICRCDRYCGGVVGEGLPATPDQLISPGSGGPPTGGYTAIPGGHSGAPLPPATGDNNDRFYHATQTDYPDYLITRPAVTAATNADADLIQP